MYKADFHIHTSYCRHAKGTVDDYVRSAIQLGMDEICITDHLHRYYLTPEENKKYWSWGMYEEDLEKYINDILKAQKEYPEIKIRMGIEADYIEGKERELEKATKIYPFDHILGSIHCLPQLGWKHMAEYKEVNSIAMYSMFFDALSKASKTGLFTCMAHPDFVWRYFPLPERYESIFEKMEQFVSTVAQNKDISIEANASAISWMADKGGIERDLFKILFSMVKKYKVPVTLGSDAHRPLAIASNFGAMISKLSDIGIKKMTIFDKFKPKKVSMT